MCSYSTGKQDFCSSLSKRSLTYFGCVEKEYAIKSITLATDFTEIQNLNFVVL